MLRPLVRSADGPVFEDPDRALLRAVAAGDGAALGRLYDRHGGAVFAFVLDLCGGDRAAAEDVLQDVMLAVWRGAGAFRGESRVRTWLLSIADRVALKARPRAVIVPFGRAQAALAADGDVSATAERRVQADAVRRAIDGLPEALRSTVTLTFFDDLPAPDVAAILGVPVGTIKSRLHRARALLHAALDAAVNVSEGSTDEL
jgi:RNA polymerase sigma-70 factor (ECF subfamily)